MQDRPYLLRRPEQSSGNRGTALRLLVCALIFAAAVLCKALATDSTDAIAAAVLRQIDGGLTLREVTEIVGRAVSDSGVLDALREGWSLEAANPDAGEPAGEDTPSEQVPSQGTTQAPAAAGGPSLENEPAFAPAEAGSAVPSPIVAESAPLEPPPAVEAEDPPATARVDEAINGQSVEDADAGQGGLPLPAMVTAQPVAIAFSYILPLRGTVTSGFGYRDHPLDGEYKFHYGVDFDAAVGTAVYAFADGEVSFTGKGEINGNYMKIIHADGVVSMYAHLEKINVRVGDKVKKGQKVALSGESGQVTGPHLHFQLYKDGLLFDPMTVLRELYNA